MARQYKTALIITGDASGGIKAVRATEKELAQLSKGFDRGGQRARHFGDETEEAGESLNTLRSTAIAAGGAIAGAFAAQNILGQARVIAETDALARTLGVSTGELQAWQYAGEQVGLQADKMSDIFKDVSDKIGDFASTGGGEAADLFEQLNLDINELLRLSPDRQLLKIGEALSQIDDPSRRTFFLESLADEAVRLQPLLENNAAGLREYAAEARALGVAMEDGAIASAVEADRAMRQVSGAVTGLTNQLAADLGPGLATAAGGLTDMIAAAGGAAAVLDNLVDVGGTLAALYGVRLVSSLAAKTTATVRDTQATIAAAQADVRAAQAATARAAESLRVAQSEQAAAQRALANSRAQAAATGNTALRSRALTQLAAANQRAIAAEAAHTQALNVQSAAMARASVAARGLDRALKLVGGPVGIALIAAGSLYAFREELGLVPSQAQASSEAVSQLTGNVDDLSRAIVQAKITDLTTQLAELKATTEEAGEAYLEAGKNNQGGGFLGADISGFAREMQEITEESSGARQEVANVEAALELLQGRLEQLGDGSGRSSFSVTSSEAAKAAEQLQKAYESTEAQLRKQIELFGVTSEVVKLRYEIEHGQLKGLAPDRADHLLSLQEELVVMQDQHRAVNRFLPELEKLQQLKRDAQAIDAMGGNLGNLAARQVERELASIASQGLDRPRSLDATVSGPLGEANRLAQEMARYQQQYDQRLEMLRAFSAEEYGIRAEAQAAISALEREHQDTVRQYEQQSQQARMQGYAGMFGSLADLSATFAGDSAGITKGLMAFQQAANLATTISNMAVAQSQAGASMPFPANLAAMATVAAQTASLVSTISSIVSPPEPSFSASSYGISGQAHAGIDNVPREGTWLLDRGERVVDSRTNQDLKRYLERESRMATQQADGGGITIHAPITVQPQQGMSEEDSARQGRAFGRAFESEVVRVLQKHKRPGGVLSGSN